MYSKVKQLRRRGQKRDEREYLAAEPCEGDLTMVACAGGYELNISAWDDSAGKPLIPPLHDARLITMHGNKMLFAGIERDGNGVGFEQEWAVQVVGAK